MMERLTVNELKALINIVAQLQVQVQQAQQFIALINKMSRMIDALEAENKDAE